MEISEAEAVFLSVIEKVPMYKLDVFQNTCVSCFRTGDAFLSLALSLDRYRQIYR